MRLLLCSQTESKTITEQGRKKNKVVAYTFFPLVFPLGLLDIATGLKGKNVELSCFAN